MAGTHALSDSWYYLVRFLRTHKNGVVLVAGVALSNDEKRSLGCMPMGYNAGVCE